MTQPIVLSVIVINYNGGERFLRCLASIYEHLPEVPVQVIVSDNASVDGSAERAAAVHPQVELVQNEANLGWCKAFNRGLRRAKGRYVLSLDNDTRVLPGAIDQLIRYLETHEEAGAAGGRLLNPDMTLQRAARGQPSAWNALFGRRSFLTRVFPGNPFTKHYLMLDHTDAREPFEVDWSSAAALMMRREVLERIGGGDEDYFVYWADADLCARIRRSGWKIYSVPMSRIVHDETLAGRKGRQSSKMVVDFHKGAYRHYVKNQLRGIWRIPLMLVAFTGLSLRAACLIGFGSCAQWLRVWRAEPR